MSIPHLKHDLGHLQGGEVVTITIKERANVRLINASNLRSYEGGQRYRFYGGQALRSPVQLSVPNADHWYVVIDFGGGTGTIHSNVTVSN